MTPMSGDFAGTCLRQGVNVMKLRFRHATNCLSSGVFLLAALLLLSGASECSGFGAFCDFDSDCSDGRFCVESECREPCSADQDCFGTDECDVVAREAEDDTVQVCVPTEEDMQPDAGADSECDMIENCCSVDSECREALDNSEAVCGFDGRCVIPVERHAVRLEGQTPPEAFSEDQVYGADIGAVFVRDVESGDAVGFARVLDYTLAEEPDVLPESILDGEPPSLDETEQCIAGDVGRDTFSLGGEQGSVLVSFVDSDGQRIRLDSSMELVVVEWGDNCFDEAESVEGFSMSFCRSFGGSVDMLEDCRTNLTGESPVSGYVVIPLDEKI